MNQRRADGLIRKITLVNWRSHERTELAFGKGTNIIVGIMGAGKSSVLEAICFALFGTFPALQAHKLRSSDIITNRPEQKTEASVELEFDVEGEGDKSIYTVKRLIGKTKGGAAAELRRDGRLIESAPERVNEYVEKLLRMDYDLFTRAIFSEQNRIDYFLAMRSGERKEKIDELLGLERFEKVRANLRGVVARLKAEMDAQRAAFAGANFDKLKAELKAVEGERDQLRRNISEGEKQMKAREADRRACETALKAVEETRQLWLSLEKNKTRYEQTLSDLKREIAQAEKAGIADHKKSGAELEAFKKELDALDASLVAVEQQRTAASAQLGSLRSKLTEMQNLAKKNEQLHKSLVALTGGAEKTPDSLKHEHAASRSNFELIRNQLASCEAALAALESAEKALRRAGAICPVCEEPLGEQKKHELLQKRKAEIARAQELASKLKTEAGTKSKQLVEMEERIGKAIELQASIRELDEAELKHLQAEVENSEALMKKLELQSDEIRKKRSSFEKDLRELEQKARIARDADERRARLKLVEIEFSNASQKLVELGFKEADVQRAHGALRECEKEMSAVNANLGNWTVQLGKANQAVADLRERIGDGEKKSAHAAELEKRVQELEIFGNAIVDVQTSLRGELIDAINSAMNSVWRTVYPYGDYSRIRLSADEAGYELEIGDGERWTAAEGAASGGERACACLALRIAFARVLVPNLSWLILDEPTHNLDSEAIRTLALALRDEIPSIVEQVFVITHEEGLKEAASGRLYLLDRNKKENEATSAELLSH